jgi:lysophospholipase L1-like esterase
MATVVDGTLQTYPLLPLMDSQLRRMAEKEEIAYFSMYHAMGGYGSMIKWVDLGLAGSDYVHFTRAGADKASKLLLEWIF